MAQHGSGGAEGGGGRGGGRLQQVHRHQSPPAPAVAHRPRAPALGGAQAQVVTAPLAPLRPPPPVTLAAPRPEAERAANEYVEAPFRTSQQQLPRPPSPATSSTSQPPPRTRTTLPPPPPPTTKQPSPTSSSPFAGGHAGVASKARPQEGGGGDCGAARPSIMCPECGRCRCDSCQQPRPLPQCWVCDNGCLLSAESVVDYASCLCCVKGLFYHCGEEEDGGGGGGAAASCADRPCSCGGDGDRRCAARWTCLAAISCVLPCLWCYWPLRGCKWAVEGCYARRSRQGCRCQGRRPPLAAPEKRLLDASPDF